MPFVETYVNIVFEPYDAKAFIRQFDRTPLTRKNSKSYFANKKVLSTGDRREVESYFDEYPILCAANPEPQCYPLSDVLFELTNGKFRL